MKTYEDLIELTPYTMIAADEQLVDFINSFDKADLVKAALDLEATAFTKAILKGVLLKLNKSNAPVSRSDVQLYIYQHYKLDSEESLKKSTNLTLVDFPELKDL